MMPQPDPTARHVFVYGTLRCGGSNDISRFSPAPQRVGDGEIAGTLFDLDAYPGAVLGGPARIKGEIYRITPALEVQLDALEEVKPDGSGEYIRREVVVEVAGRPIACLVYEIHPARIEGRPVIASGDWMSRA
ncbi:gamma-glutamylcyclotransferase family protein [Variovorax sp. Sphag1AA]|uniref:gamma-glutamylcyclotransferase family protein n=1 Tax=Variovorax sp. Sphag1AA TaxID=2587027 RepID=UPI00185C0F75|nr:gamma-glutamylcyclotransferase family protein [Variovorax sp. Sphag1AA]MBB3178837.1 gamma-glutamylcyclotransferase (GGCT)/AIG2-like uncharacterized protein YtfP [Variovorax sp. Sphag1AA]